MGWSSRPGCPRNSATTSTSSSSTRPTDFVFGFSKLDVMFGRHTAAAVRHPYRDLVKPGVRFVQSDDPIDRSSREAGRDRRRHLRRRCPGGRARRRPASGGHARSGRGRPRVLHRSGAFALRDVIAGFNGGRVIVGVTSTPFKCPPAPSETALLMHDFLTERGLRDELRDRARHAACGPGPAVAGRVRGAASSRSPSGGSPGTPAGSSAASIPSRRVAILSDDSEMPYDLFLGIPVHRAPAVVEAAGLTVDGWVPVNPLTLETSVPGRLRGGRRHERRHPEGRCLRRGSGRGRRRRHRRAHPGRHAVNSVRRSRACATSSSAPTRLRSSTSHS